MTFLKNFMREIKSTVVHDSKSRGFQKNSCIGVNLFMLNALTHLYYSAPRNYPATGARLNYQGIKSSSR